MSESGTPGRVRKEGTGEGLVTAWEYDGVREQEVIV